MSASVSMSIEIFQQNYYEVHRGVVARVTVQNQELTVEKEMSLGVDVHEFASTAAQLILESRLSLCQVVAGGAYLWL